MAVAAPPRVSEPAKGPFSRSNFLGFINVADCAHFLKLRHNWRASDRLRLEMGLDYDPKANSSRPWAGVRMKLDDCANGGWAVEVNTDWAVVQTPRVDLLGFTDAASLPVDLRLGTDFYAGDAPHVEIGIHNGKVTLALLAVSLATGAPIRIKRKEVGGWAVGVPVRFKGAAAPVDHTLNTKAEMDATLQRQGRGINLAFHQLNALLRLRQDD